MRHSMRPLARLFPAVLVTAAWLISIPTANAQLQSETPGSETPGLEAPGSSDQTVNITEQKLNAAAAAIERIANVKEDYKQRIEAAAPAEKDRVADEGNSALVKAVTDQGLSIAEYASILVVAQNNPEVREKILERNRPKDGSSAAPAEK